MASDLHREEPDEEELEFKHAESAHFEDPKAAALKPGAANDDSRNGDNRGGVDRHGVVQKFGNESMVYHGPRTVPQEAPRQAAPAPVRREAAKVGRNDQCPCGSGKKFKKCHGQSGAESVGAGHEA